MFLNREGRFIARPRVWGVKIEQGKCPQFAVTFDCLQEEIHGDWQICNGGEEITGFFTLIDGKGQPITFQLENIRDAFGWTDGKFSSLDQGDWSQTEVQIVCGYEEYKGKNRLKVQYLNPRDYVSGADVKKADSSALKNLDAQFGPLVRAAIGVKPGANGKPANPANSPAEQAKSVCWKKFLAKRTDTPAEERNEEWKKIVSGYCEGSDPKTLAADDWNKLGTLIQNGKFDPVASPIGDEQQFTGDDIPFDLAR